ncbi:DUF2829 domain-containing protein [Pluralibacter gergoviae]|uniref:DUF2829 domain-containing protein n=1 Tax=Pluralibacter gergoviae TaxID=61647 RepID=UPI0004F5B6DE|nr:DUF2829 domain-containing protein [Pluralibacter gergoviae]AIQ99732.1 hypothetical protein LG71_07430 [Pluralibacter gergoviae]EKW6617191.1 DUF2829 domain-containing protein [Pluralibacter gergoviae]EKW9968311.1 DUF2829 domain-containing protein [Pluralibacter gergoviae]KOR05145.1 hypothetical protein ABW48_01970 [Pluralibacter gergoviae]MCK1065572.1 DUF2829 domain-containing protein [Pluralibacter gergoviae]
MSDLTAVEGSFEWAIIELKNGKRVSREAWKEKKMYLVRNPGDPNQTVKDGDWLANAGVPVDAAFDYLPNIVLCNAEGNFVPYQPSQVDMEMKDWEELVETSGYMLVADITNGYTLFPDEKEVWGFYDYSDVQTGKDNIIENKTPCNSILQICHWESKVFSLFTIHLACEKEHFDALAKLMKKSLKVMINGATYNLNKVTGSSYKTGENYGVSYDISTIPELKNIFMTENQTHRFYCTWAD